jgi:septum formation protein
VHYNQRVELLLASTSPRRRELLATLGLPFKVAAGEDVDEAGLLAAHGGTLEERLMALVRRKGEQVAREHPAAVVLSADTVVVIDGAVLGKPLDAAEAREMLSRLSGRMHEVYTAVAVQHAELNYAALGCEITRVHFYELSSRRIARYIEREQPYDKAGAYAIQGLGALLVARIEGDYPNVVGLPLGLTARLLERAGLSVL